MTLFSIIGRTILKDGRHVGRIVGRRKALPYRDRFAVVWIDGQVEELPGLATFKDAVNHVKNILP